MRYELYFNQNGARDFSDHEDNHEARKYGAGHLANMLVDKTGTLTNLATGEQWELSVEVRTVRQ